MERVYKINRDGKEIICLDFSNYNIRTKDELKSHIDKAKTLISRQPLKSALVITIATNTTFDRDIVEFFKDFTKSNTPYVKASALVGITGMQKILLSAVKFVTGRDFYLCDSIEEASEWLAKQ